MPFGGWKPGAEIHRTEIASRKLQRDRRAPRPATSRNRPILAAPETPTRAGQPLWSGLQCQVERVEPQGSCLLVEGEHRAQPRTALDAQAIAMRPARLEIDRRRHALGGQDRREKAVGAVGRHVDAAIFDFEEE